MKKALVLFGGVVALAASSAMAQQYIVNDGVDQVFYDAPSDGDLARYNDATRSVVTNATWEWMGAQSWLLPGWDGSGLHPSGPHYENGQYGPDKSPRDFTASRFGAFTGPAHTPGVVPAFQTGVWIHAPGSVLRTEKATVPGDYAMRALANSQSHGFVTSSAPATGTRVKFSVDYINEGGGEFKFKVFGFLNNNQDRKPFFTPYPLWNFAGDVDSQGVAYGDSVYAGPDMFCTWRGDGREKNTGQLLLDANAGANVAAAADWTTYTESFTLAKPEDARVVGVTDPKFDNLMFQWTVAGSGTQWRAVDNLKMQIIKPGDADENGDVSGVDVGVWAVNFTGTLPEGTGGKTWYDGDWNGDACVDGVDVGIWATNFTGTLSSGLSVDAAGASPEAVAMLQSMGITVVPEPASLGLLGLGALAMLHRRRA